MSSTGRARGPAVSRRALVKAGAWTAPVVVLASPVPAFAVSGPCASTSYDYTVDWGVSSWTRDNARSGTAVATSANVAALGMNVTFAMASYGVTGVYNDNFTVPATNVGGLGQRALRLHQGYTAHNNLGTRNNRSVVTVTFARPVTGLSFTMTDVDSADGDFWDRVELSPSPSTAVLASGLRGSGTQASPWRMRDSDTGIGDNANGGNITVTYSGTLSQLVLTYWNSADDADNDPAGDQVITLADFSFQAAGC